MADADRPAVTVEQVERLVDAQRQALASRDPAMLERANAALAAALDALRRTAPATHDARAARRLRSMLRAHAELVARGQAATDRALSVLMPEAGDAYAGRVATRPRSGNRHAVA